LFFEGAQHFTDKHLDEADLRDGIVVPLPVLRVSVTKGAAVTGVDFVLDYATPAPIPSGLPSAGTGSDQTGVVMEYLAGALGALTMIGVVGGIAFWQRRRRHAAQ
jgi:hypothetical protein